VRRYLSYSIDEWQSLDYWKQHAYLRGLSVLFAREAGNDDPEPDGDVTVAEPAADGGTPADRIGEQGAGATTGIDHLESMGMRRVRLPAQ
jgi:hypothetical protein